MLYTCKEDTDLPQGTLCASFATSCHLNDCLPRWSVDIVFDPSLDDDRIYISSDVYDQLAAFLGVQDQSGTASEL